MSQCRIKPSKLRLVFLSYKHSDGRPFTLDVLPTGKAACPYRRMVDYIKLRGKGQGPLFRYANKLPVQKTAIAKYLKAVIANTELTSQISPLNKLKPWGAGIPILTRNISRLYQSQASHLRKVCWYFMSTSTSLHQPMTHVPSCDDIPLSQHCTGEFKLHCQVHSTSALDARA